MSTVYGPSKISGTILTKGDGGTDTSEHEEERGDELGDIGLDGGGAEGVADGSERERFTILLVLTELRELKVPARSRELMDRSVHRCRKVTQIRPLLYRLHRAKLLNGRPQLVDYIFWTAWIITTNILIPSRGLAYCMIGSSPPENHYTLF
jgi:hypothetical protein